MPDASRPNSDINTTSWTNQSGGTTNLYSAIDEVVNDESDYVTTTKLTRPTPILHPNVLFILSDDEKETEAGPQYLRDRHHTIMHQAGVWLPHTRAHWSVCEASRFAFMTGQYRQNNGSSGTTGDSNVNTKDMIFKWFAGDLNAPNRTYQCGFVGKVVNSYEPSGYYPVPDQFPPFRGVDEWRGCAYNYPLYYLWEAREYSFDAQGNQTNFTWRSPDMHGPYTDGKWHYPSDPNTAGTYPYGEYAADYCSDKVIELINIFENRSPSDPRYGLPWFIWVSPINPHSTNSPTPKGFGNGLIDAVRNRHIQAYTTGTTKTYTASVTAGSNIITYSSSLTTAQLNLIATGVPIAGPGIPANTYIAQAVTQGGGGIQRQFYMTSDNGGHPGNSALYVNATSTNTNVSTTLTWYAPISDANLPVATTPSDLYDYTQPRRQPNISPGTPGGSSGGAQSDAGRMQCIIGLDDLLETATDHIESLGLTGSTYVVYSSDNGFARGETDAIDGTADVGGKQDIKDSTCKIGLSIRGPAIDAGIVRTDINNFFNTDFAPTIADLCNITPSRTDNGLTLSTSSFTFVDVHATADDVGKCLGPSNIFPARAKITGFDPSTHTVTASAKPLVSGSGQSVKVGLIFDGVSFKAQLEGSSGFSRVVYISSQEAQSQIDGVQTDRWIYVRASGDWPTSGATYPIPRLFDRQQDPWQLTNLMAGSLTGTDRYDKTKVARVDHVAAASTTVTTLTNDTTRTVGTATGGSTVPTAADIGKSVKFANGAGATISGVSGSTVTINSTNIGTSGSDVLMFVGDGTAVPPSQSYTVAQIALALDALTTQAQTWDGSQAALTSSVG